MSYPSSLSLLVSPCLVLVLLVFVQLEFVHYAPLLLWLLHDPLLIYLIEHPFQDLSHLHQQPLLIPLTLKLLNLLLNERTHFCSLCPRFHRHLLLHDLIQVALMLTLYNSLFLLDSRHHHSIGPSL